VPELPADIAQAIAGKDGSTEQRLVHGESSYPVSMTLIVAVLLLLLGLLAIVSMVFNVGPF
jgi:putative membrane protein